jgi:hypothetical protein
MANYLVSYDLEQPGPQNYARLESRLLELEAVRVLYSQWILKFHGGILDVERDLMKYIDPSTDGLLVVPIEQGRNIWNHLRMDDAAFKKWLAT